jgi:hypothetical protein
MSEDRGETEDQGDARDPREDYIAPALTDLGSFEELTKLTPGVAPDSEGAS